MTTPNWDQFFSIIRKVPQDWENAKSMLDNYLQETSNQINNRELSFYSTEQIPSGKSILLSGSTYDINREYVDFGALPNAAVKTAAHGITPINSTFRLFDLYLVASDPVNFKYFRLDYWSIAAADIKIDIEGANIIVTTASNYSTYTDCYVVIEYFFKV